MTTPGKILTAMGFVAMLLAFGAADFALTHNTLHLPPHEGVIKKAGPDVTAIAQHLGFTVVDTTEQNFLPAALSAGSHATVSARVLLKNNDRATTVAWVDAPDVKEIFTALKKNLRPSFSEKLENLIDETQSRPGKSPREVLSFHDPALHPDTLLFVRIRERLYEFHVGEGHEKEMDTLIDALTD